MEMTVLKPTDVRAVSPGGDINTPGDALSFLRQIYQNPKFDLHWRMRAAVACLPFERPKLAVTAITTTEDLATRLEAAIQATGKVIDARPATLIEKPTEAMPTPVREELVTAEDMAKPFARLDTDRFRRF
jgi:hypothetical protein